MKKGSRKRMDWARARRSLWRGQVVTNLRVTEWQVWSGARWGHLCRNCSKNREIRCVVRLSRGRAALTSDISEESVEACCSKAQANSILFPVRPCQFPSVMFHRGGVMQADNNMPDFKDASWEYLELYHVSRLTRLNIRRHNGDLRVIPISLFALLLEQWIAVTKSRPYFLLDNTVGLLSPFLVWLRGDSNTGEV